MVTWSRVCAQRSIAICGDRMIDSSIRAGPVCRKTNECIVYDWTSVLWLSAVVRCLVSAESRALLRVRLGQSAGMCSGEPIDLVWLPASQLEGWPVTYYEVWILIFYFCLKGVLESWSKRHDGNSGGTWCLFEMIVNLHHPHVLVGPCCVGRSPSPSPPLSLAGIPKWCLSCMAALQISQPHCCAGPIWLQGSRGLRGCHA